MNNMRFPKELVGIGLILLTTALAQPGLATASGADRQPANGAAEAPGQASAFLQLAAGAPTNCSCGAFICKGKEFPACTMQCVEPETAVCECGFCERTMGSPNSTALGPVANLCACH